MNEVPRRPDIFERLGIRLVDVAIVLAMLVPTAVVIGIDDGDGTGLPAPLALSFAALTVLPLLVRRRWPFAVLLVVVAVSMSVTSMTMFSPPTLIAVYTVAALSDRTKVTAAAGVAVASFIGHRLIWGGDLAAVEWATVLSLTGFVIALGLYQRTRQAYRGELADRAVAEERLRIARELHDAVGHNTSLIVISAEALAAGTSGEERERAQAIARLGRQAMDEMRATLELMRPGEAAADRLPEPSLDELPALVERAREAGIGAELRVHGAPRPVSPAVGISAYRIVQEALTNVVRHAAARQATVDLRYEARAIGLEVVDDGVGPGVAGPTLGHGLIGMRERAALFGGELEYGALNGHGFRVAARLPIEAVDEALVAGA